MPLSTRRSFPRGNAARLVRQEWLDGRPFIIGEFVAHDSTPSVRSLNHSSAIAFNISREAPATVWTVGQTLSWCGWQGTILGINVERRMNRVFLAIPLCLVVSGVAFAQQKSAREQIVGAWTLVSVTSEM